jgi:hypothetical protein
MVGKLMLEHASKETGLFVADSAGPLSLSSRYQVKTCTNLAEFHSGPPGLLTVRGESTSASDHAPMYAIVDVFMRTLPRGAGSFPLDPPALQL